eukprot:CAMPEP_0117055772 /NCGR_PEP_ID=MMETSP0472-20121206/38691_1 /TAXON_ID=693140 ORGANISM="Tiarina fusus, Strain LIS" /NCGR_SAMPLE_ID=MMETSP0472 /ASSEMBLY_ACC=CAM_ASM_000603 /LENGTH=1686 /DNA_ID=CAMNT_0004771953 /DNA_START=109 /DNA_END=5169 /DNA_ORIENTATION=-
MEVPLEETARDPDKFDDDDDASAPSIANVRTASWFIQFYWATWKNCILLSRRPLTLCVMLLSSVISAVLSWLVGRDPDDPIYLPLTECGVANDTLPSDLYQENDYYDRLQDTLNDRWMTGLPVALLALGPAMNAILVFNTIYTEFQFQLLGALRSLGLRDSVYWMSWLAPFVWIALINSLLGAVTLALMSGHVYESVYFGGMLGSLVVLQLSLITASFFLAAVCGTGRKMFSNFAILIMFAALWVPTLMVLSSWDSGLFWSNKDTTQGSGGGVFYYSDDDWWRNSTNSSGFRGDIDFRRDLAFDANASDVCNTPIMNEFQGQWFKTDAERALVQDDEFFVGCYTAASWGVGMWNKPVAMIFLAWFPYFHFLNIWANFAGYTSLPDNQFTASEASLSVGELAAKALGSNADPDWGLSSAMAPQQSMFFTPDDVWKYRDYNDYEADSNCPDPDHPGANLCDYLYECKYAQGGGPVDGPSVMAIHGYLLLLALVYLLLAAYWAQVFPGGNGRPEPFYFPLLPRYWFPSPSKKNTDGENEAGGDTENGTERQDGVVIDTVRKEYGAFTALNGVSFNLARGEVTALLGHNGAGKTTLARILCCEIPATDGDMSIFGHSISEDPYTARNMIGLCKQDDYLWPNLNAKEHLELFAGLRGVPSYELEHKVQKWLRSVDLEGPQLQFASAYSGGMKRRLSLALATIGDRPLIILDEPTTGMDPVSRRFVWRHIEEIKDDRVVLLTTHAMEEADLLADEVAIIRKGELAAFGSPLQLKTEHGTSLQFSLLADKEAVVETEASVRNFFSNSQEFIDIETSAAGTIVLKILKLKQKEGDEGLDVSELAAFAGWLDSEESTVTEYGFSNSSLEEVFLKVTEGDVEENEETPVVEAQELIDVTAVPPDPIVDPESARNQDLGSFVPNLSFLNQTFAIFVDFWQRSWTGRGSRVNYILFGLFLFGAVMLGLFVGKYDASAGVFVGVVCFLSLPLIVVIGPTYADRAGGQLYLMRSQGLLPLAYVSGAGLYALSIQLVYGLILLSALYATPSFRDPLNCEEDYDACGWERRVSPEQGYPSDFYNFNDVFNGERVILSTLRSSGGYGKIFGLVVVLALTFPGAMLSASFLPGFRIPIAVISFITLGLVSLPVIMSAIFILDPKKSEMCLNTTISPNDICNSDFYLNNTGTEFLNCVGAQTMNNYLGYGTLCVPARSSMLPQFGIFNTLTMTYFAKIRFLSNPPNYVEDILIPNLIANDVKCSGDTCTFPLADGLYWGNLAYMLLGAFLLLILGCIMAFVLEFPVGPVLQVQHLCKHLFDRLLCKASHDDESPPSTDSQGGEEEEMKEVAEEREVVEKIVKPFVHSGDSLHPYILHSRLERDNVPAVLTHKLRKVYPALGGRPPKVALSSLDLHVPAGQVLGLLGKNGAGKTTALKVLSCAHDSSGGIGLIAGYDCADEKIQVFERLGNCAQFDVIWEARSVKQHIEFFARLKGLPMKEVANAARSIATAVGLGDEDAYHRNAGALSGGMRRRLSLGLSLIGAPKVVILDEPTTGLDPATRSNIWNLINSFSSNDRSIIITTHMMIEADTLCDRIAIISNGKLKVVGTQQHLKDNFGSGYLLQLNLLNRSSEDRAMAFVRKHLHPQATIGGRQGKTLRVNLPQDLKLDRVFSALYSEERATEGCINQFLLSQSSLEDVFIALGD